MCGITGIFHFESQHNVDRSLLKKMADTIHHRGPDGEGYYIKDRVGLAHRRLSIIDLASGYQPMLNDTQDIAIVFNGEIYNYIELKQELEHLGYSFRTTSDTEVIIRAYEAWDINCQEKFNGMWAFAIWDDRKKHLFISRDRIGEKPLNYTIIDNTFVFGSEIKSIQAFDGGLKPDLNLLEIYLFLGYIPAPYTFYKNVKKLRSGHYIIVNEQGVNEYKYWELPEVDEHELLVDEQSVCEEFSQLFYDSVRIRMRSDVPFGAFLSGGLDSSSIVALMADISPHPVETFTIGFEEKAFDERGMAQLVANQFQTHHHEKVVQRSTFDEALQKILFHYDEPFADPAAIPTGYVADSARNYVKMVLTGDGGDEVFAGYSHYQSERIAGEYNSVLPPWVKQQIPVVIRGVASLFSGDIRYKLNRGERVLNGFNLPFRDRLLTKFVNIPPAEVKKLTLENHWAIEDFLAESLQNCAFSDPFYQLTYFNLKVSLPEQMMVKVDKMSMAHSLETRAPFLDYRIVELMYRVSKIIKMPSYQDKGVKNILKKSMTNKLPQTILNRQKKGFDVPLREWFKDDTFEKRMDVDFTESGLNRLAIQELIVANKMGKGDSANLLWRSIVYHTWLKQF